MTLRGFAILLMLCALFGHGQSQGTSKETGSLLTLLNGAYDNREQVQNENSGVDVTSMRFIPTVVSGLGPDPVLFVQEMVNNKIRHTNVLAVAEECSTLTTLSIYNATLPSLYEKPPGSITVDDVSNLQLGYLQPVYNCVVRFQIIDDNLLIGVWQNCLNSNNGIRVSIVRENDFYMIVPPRAPETSTLVTYHFVRRGPRFSIPGETSNSDNADD